MARGYLSTAPDTTEIFLLKPEPSQRMKQKSVDRIGLYARTSTLGALKAAGLTPSDIRYDAMRGLICVVGYTPPAKPKAKPRPKKVTADAAAAPSTDTPPATVETIS